MKDYSRHAVFARNHLEYLDDAVQIEVDAPGRLLTFRSKKPWTEAKRAVDSEGAIPVYFSPNGSKGLVEFQGLLQAVHVDPDPEDSYARWLLGQCHESTRGEGLWISKDGQVRTLYVIKSCRKLERPFPMTSLIKVSDGKSIHPDYGYSYSVVYDRTWRSVDGSPALLPDEAMSSEAYPEGACQRVYVNRYERNAKARARCIKEHGAVCKVCGFDFEQVYGEIGRGFIHVHHKTPLEQITEAYEVDPVKDLVPVCPNCHAMLHRGTGEAMSVEALREQLDSQGWLPRVAEAG